MHYSQTQSSDLSFQTTHNLKSLSNIHKATFKRSSKRSLTIQPTIDSDINFKRFKYYLQKRKSEPLPNDLSTLRTYLDNEYSNEDEHKTSEYFIITTIDELILTLFVIFTIGSGIIYYETFTCRDNECIINKELTTKAINISLLFVSIGALLFIISLIPKYIHRYKLYLSAQYISYKESICTKHFIPSFIIEFVLALIHPNLLFKDKVCLLSKTWNRVNVKYNVNDLLLVLMLIRMFYIIKVVLILTDYYSARADRICKMMGMRLNMFFTLKCVLLKYTGYVLFFTTFLFGFVLAYMMKVIEGPVALIVIDDDHRRVNNSYLDYGNCFWNVFITMTTVGFGDYYPISLLGRIVCMVSALFGNVLVSMNINYLQRKTEISSDEQNAFSFIQRMEEREVMQCIAATYFKANFTYFVNKKKMLRQRQRQMVGEEDKVELVKLARMKFEKRKQFKKCLQ